MILKNIKQLLIVGLLLLSIESVEAAKCPSTKLDSVIVLKPAEKHTLEVEMTISLLNRYHYLKIEMNDSLSAVIFKNYLGALDANKAYFTKSDIDYFSKYEYQLDDFLKTRNVDVAFQIFRIFRDRANSRLTSIQTIIDNGFDYNKDESIAISDDEREWLASEEEINEQWRKIVKSQALSYKLDGKSDTEIKETLTKRYKRYRLGINQYNSDDVFQFYMNAVSSSYDPHTSYFSPVSAANFDIDMNLSLEGIGARLTQSMDYTVINEVIAGGPAYKSKELQKDDKIVAVAQGSEDYVDVIGWRLQDVVQLIRGPKGSVIRMKILVAGSASGAPLKVVELIREKIKLEEQSASAEMIPISKGKETYNLGIITLPSFYMNFEDARNGVEDYKSASRDVQKLIAELQTQDVDGILIDLRFNGGGSLPEAINLTGLFIDKGPVVQVRHSNGEIDVNINKNTGVVYDGPLAILVNRFSASASEIFSAAIQDYQRGIVIGENTFGKGTVQQMAGYNRYYPNYPEKMGSLKFTLSKYYRITGSSTQNIGVIPDVEFPSAFSAEEFGESGRANSLKWDQIPTSDFDPTNTVSTEIIKKLNILFDHDMQSDIDLKNMQEDIAAIQKNRDKTTLSLNFLAREEERNDQKEKNELQDKLSESAGEMGNELTSASEDQKKLREDPYLKESLKLLAELID